MHFIAFKYLKIDDLYLVNWKSGTNSIGMQNVETKKIFPNEIHPSPIKWFISANNRTEQNNNNKQ